MPQVLSSPEVLAAEVLVVSGALAALAATLGVLTAWLRRKAKQIEPTIEAAKKAVAIAEPWGNGTRDALLLAVSGLREDVQAIRDDIHMTREEAAATRAEAVQTRRDLHAHVTDTSAHHQHTSSPKHRGAMQ